jgi:hypothetical protein
MHGEIWLCQLAGGKTTCFKLTMKGLGICSPLRLSPWLTPWLSEFARNSLGRTLAWVVGLVSCLQHTCIHTPQAIGALFNWQQPIARG